MKKYLFFLPLALLLTFCSAAPAAQPTPDIAAMVAATLTATAGGGQPALVEEPALPLATGSIEGRLSYPSNFIPPMRVVAIQVATGQYYSLDTATGQATYRLDGLPEAKYNVLAYALDDSAQPTGLAGGYTQAVMCGLTAECENHDLVDVIVFSGEVSSDVDLTDWYGTNFPPMP